MTPPTFDRERFLKRFWEMDAKLVAAGFPATSPWWRDVINRFVRSGCRRWVIRAGRRAGKSTTLARLAVAWAWFGPWSVPPGDTAVVPYISVSKDEATGRIRTIAAVLKALGLAFDQRGDEIDLTSGRRVLFKVLACNTSAVVGFTSICVFGDECARWESRDTTANPAREVIGSLAPTLATQPFGFMVLCSSPWSTDDYHAELYEQGDTDHQLTSFAQTWVANPTITEAQTHELEPDQRVWEREYGAEPGATVSAALDLEDVNACFTNSFPASTLNPFVAIDASSLRGDAFTWMAGHVTQDDVLIVREVSGWEGSALRSVSMENIVDEISTVARRYRCGVYGDQREEAALTAMFRQQSVTLTTYAWSEPSKDSAMQLLRRLMRAGRVKLPEHATLKRELVGMKARLMPSGRVSYSTNGLDYASALVTLMHASVAGDFRLAANDNGGLKMYRSTRASPTDSLRESSSSGPRLAHRLLAEMCGRPLPTSSRGRRNDRFGGW